MGLVYPCLSFRFGKAWVCDPDTACIPVILAGFDLTIRKVSACIRYALFHYMLPLLLLLWLDYVVPSSGLMFLFFINDILTNINSNIDGIFTINEMKIFLLLFADDAVLFAQTPTALQSMLNDLEQYCNTWGLKINTNKTKVMIFERGRSTNHDFILCDET